MSTTRSKKNTPRVTDAVANAAGHRKATKKIKTKKVVVPVNHVAVVVDESSSMRGYVDQVVNSVNEQFGNVRVASEAEGQETYVTLRTFSSNVNAPVFFAQDVAEFRNWTRRDYNPNGMTALNDAIGYTMRDLERVKDAKKDHVSFLLLVITDGHENVSDEFRNTIRKKISTAQDTDRWSVVCLVPPGCERSTSRNLGIPLGNIRAWEQSEAGFEDMNRNVSAGIASYYTARSAGATRTDAFFVDATHIQEADLENLNDVSGDFYVWNVDTVDDGDKTRIDEFVTARIARNQRVRRQLGGQFQIGRGYYELTKSELIQETKDVAIQHTDTGKIYGGRDARNLLKIPAGQRMRIRPGQLDGYRIFVKSTSLNRNLIGGSKFLYSKN